MMPAFHRNLHFTTRIPQNCAFWKHLCENISTLSHIIPSILYDIFVHNNYFLNSVVHKQKPEVSFHMNLSHDDATGTL